MTHLFFFVKIKKSNIKIQSNEQGCVSQKHRRPFESKPQPPGAAIFNLMFSLLPLLIYPGIIYKKVLHIVIKTKSDYIILIFMFQGPEIFLVVCCTFFSFFFVALSKHTLNSCNAFRSHLPSVHAGNTEKSRGGNLSVCI